MNVAIINYDAGNVFSVLNALQFLKIPAKIVSFPSELADATHLILPGVGAFGECMAKLAKHNFITPIKSWLATAKPFIGICLGYQILFENSEESPDIPGLAIFSGTNKRFTMSPGFKIPHIGWNSVSFTPNASDIWKNSSDNPHFYFVHSYFPVFTTTHLAVATTTYGSDTFVAAIENKNLLACQFHPEKSQDNGLALIKNFCLRTL